MTWQLRINSDILFKNIAIQSRFTNFSYILFYRPWNITFGLVFKRNIFEIFNSRAQIRILFYNVILNRVRNSNARWGRLFDQGRKLKLT